MSDISFWRMAWWRLLHWKLSLKYPLHTHCPGWPGCGPCSLSRHWSTPSPLSEWAAEWPRTPALHSSGCSSSLWRILRTSCVQTGRGQLCYLGVGEVHRFWWWGLFWPALVQADQCHKGDADHFWVPGSSCWFKTPQPLYSLLISTLNRSVEKYNYLFFLLSIHV